MIEEPVVENKSLLSDEPFVKVSLKKFEDKVYRTF